MNISYKWLREYLDLNLSVNELKDKLTFSGIEVEAIHTSGELLKQIIIGEIVSKEKHPEADKLSVCNVFDGKETLQVVCGAPNCAAGQKIAFAPVGTEFPEFKIKKAKLRGIESNGMICSEAEMGISDNHDGIMVLPADAPIGQSLDGYLKLSDTIFEVEITPNRPDLLGMIGIARDLSAQLDINMNEGTISTSPAQKNVGGNNHSPNPIIENTVPTLCPRYTAVKISGVKVAPSPSWLIEKLKAADIKPINNIVDITNYVMYEYGHPLHAFDAKYVAGNKIAIRKSKPNEVFPALDNQTYTLTGAELVIADTEKPIALAGVIGGKNSHITNDTTDIILEAACFDPSITRRTSFNLKIFTDSAYRFERGMTPQTCEIISARATQLILELASASPAPSEGDRGGTTASNLLDSYPNPQPNKVIALRPSRVKHLLSISLDNHKIIAYLKALGCQFLKADADALYFEIPPFRIDMVREIDLIEEIIRLHGFHSVPEAPQIAQVMNKDLFYTRRTIKNLLVSNGFNEAINLSFTDPAILDLLKLSDDDPRRNVVRILNPQGASFSILRSTLLPQLLKNVLLNLNHGDENIALFEMNKVFFERNKDFKISDKDSVALEKWRLTGVWTGKSSPLYWKSKQEKIDFYDVKGIVEAILSTLKISNFTLKPSQEPFYLPNSGFDIVATGDLQGSLGKIDTKVLQAFDIDTDIYAFDLDLDALFTLANFKTTKFTDLPKYPTVHRDLSFVVSEQYQMSEIIKTINEVNPKLIQSVVPFDQYKGKNIKDGFRSLSISIALNSQQKTLTDEQIKTIMTKIIEQLTQKYHIEMR